MKTYVGIIAEFTPEGVITPLELIWENSRRFTIDRVLETRRAASLKAGGVGTRYKCMIQGRERFLFYEGDGRWFVES